MSSSNSFINSVSFKKVDTAQKRIKDLAESKFSSPYNVHEKNFYQHVSQKSQEIYKQKGLTDDQMLENSNVNVRK